MLKEKLAAMAQQTAEKLPAEAMAVVQSTTQAVAESIATRAIPKVGGELPGFKLSDSQGNTFDSGDHVGAGHLVVTFFRGGW